MCGISAILLGDVKATTAAVELHESIYYLQHRGQDAAGITVCQGGRLYQMKGNGMASKVFQEPARLAENLPGYGGISHVRYPTAGTSSASEAQPFYDSPFGLSLAVNGNLVNSEELRSFLDLEARRHVNTDSDSELLLNVYAHALHELGKARANADDIFAGLRDVYARCKGGFACVAMITGFGILGFKDENGIRPLCLGSRPSGTLEGALDYMMASESVALTQLGFTDIVDILPGQAVFIQKGGKPQFRQIVPMKSYTPDMPDSMSEGISVHRSRQNMGRKLADKMKEILGDKGIEEIDVVIPIPETSNTSASVLANCLNKPLSNAFVKNRYTFRTFIMPGQKARQQGIRRKLSPIQAEFRDKVVLLVDDSIVRGNTSREIVLMSREAGAKKVILASCSPEIRHQHVYGIDLADPSQLVARGKTRQEIAKEIGADELIYQSLDDLKAACLEAIDGETQITGFEVGVFSGEYQTDVPESYFEHLKELRAGKGLKRKTTEEPGPDAKKLTLIANGGPVNGPARSEPTADMNEAMTSQEDISLHNFATGR
ncbi:amidophosphoribosyltransferase [Cordyceps militaris CM01]|uniref:Amidophosphoribosyltransferase n=2 Tax=Cordyceps militaris TaxID=73501 RepID=G3JS46_CORMM|nr:amidophosphoribosyltransferase [Cordyceps militaris CM01]ATY63022.1 amidophosphoribosyltransferase [Cordyceps militaris]EGX88692.1 amidophosphoribosyltransferase [Cordyceps militaris CM01]